MQSALAAIDGRLRKRLARIHRLDAHGLHRLRILVKRQRYLLEAAADLFHGKRFEAYLGWLRDWQQQLGSRNDLTLAATHLKALRTMAGTLDEAELCGLLQGWLRGLANQPVVIGRLPKPFWE